MLDYMLVEIVVSHKPIKYNRKNNNLFKKIVFTKSVLSKENVRGGLQITTRFIDCDIGRLLELSRRR